MENKVFIGKFLKKNGKVNFKSRSDEDLFKILCDKLKEGAVVDIMVDFSSNNGLLSQIAKVKAGTKDIAKETGYTFIEVEHLIKKQAGLYDEVNDIYKSFANASFEDLSNAIQVMIQIGETCNLNLK